MKISKKAFSLIEISVVTVILAMLVVGIMQGTKVVKNARLAQAQKLTKDSPVALMDNLVLWLETTSEGSLINSNNSTNIKDNETIQTWNDLNPKSITKNNATQTTAANRPRYVKNVINNLPVLRFDGTDDFLTYDGSALANSSYTFFVVEQRRSNKSDNYFFGGITDRDTNKNLYSGYVSDTQVTSAQYSNNISITIPSYSTPKPTIHTSRLSLSTGRSYYLNGGTTYSITSATTTSLKSYSGAAIGVAIGKDSTEKDSTYYYNGDIAEIIIFNTFIEDTDSKLIEKYLAKKWGISCCK